VRSPLLVETEREKVCQQLKQASDEAARLQDDLRDAPQKETQLLDDMNLETEYRERKSKMTGLPA